MGENRKPGYVSNSHRYIALLKRRIVESKERGEGAGRGGPQVAECAETKMDIIEAQCLRARSEGCGCRSCRF